MGLRNQNNFTDEELENQIRELERQLEDPNITPEKRQVLDNALDRLIAQSPNTIPSEPEEPNIFEKPAVRNDIINRLNNDLKKNSEPATSLQTPLPIQPSDTSATLENEEDVVEPFETPIEPTLPTRQEPDTEDEFQSLYNKYKTDVETARTQQSQYDTDLEEAETRSRTATGIAGALQAFGEGLAAITGGSAKPLQTGAEALRSSMTEGVEVAKRKAGSLKDRIMMAREPLETKSEEMKLRDAIEQRQKQKRLADPTSPESMQAQEKMANMLEIFAAHAGDKGSTMLQSQLLGLGKNLNSMSANDLTDLSKQLQGLTASSKENVIGKQERAMETVKAKLEGQLTVLQKKKQHAMEIASIKDENKVKVRAEDDFKKAQDEIAKGINETKIVKKKMIEFIGQLNKAMRGDVAAQNYVAQEANVVAYLNARSYESKGVFTDNDLESLDQLRGGAGRSWKDKFENWFSKGWEGTQSVKELETFKEILERRMPDFDNPEKEVRQRYAENFRHIASVSDHPIYNKYADIIEDGGRVSQQPIQITREQLANQNHEQMMNDAGIKDGQQFKYGDKLYIRKGKTFESVGNSQ